MRRFRTSGDGDLSRRINKMAPQYTKTLIVTCGLALVAVFGFSYLNDEHELAYPGRALLQDMPRICNGDTILPIIPYENTWPLHTRAILYVLFLGWLFLGVAISADCFMAAIEVITSATDEVEVGGEKVEVEVWNSTVANLTLMALGSSAPEILLAVVETVSLKFTAGDLGPGCIVGSAAFNLLFITAICISCLDEDKEDPSALETRMIEEFGVFVITAIASLFAYLWMVIVLAWVSTDEVTVDEAIITFLMFPLLVWVSWAEDSGWWGWCGSDAVTPEGEDGAPEEGRTRGRLKSVSIGDGPTRRLSHKEASAVIDASEQGDVDPKAAAQAAAQAQMKKKKKTRLQYRIQATRQMTGGKRVLPSDKPATEIQEEEAPATTPILGFKEAKYECDESCDIMTVVVQRTGVLDKACTVKFDTSDGDITDGLGAQAGAEYISATGDLSFAAGETEKTIDIKIVDDNEWAPDKHFYVRLFSPTAAGSDKPEDVVLGTATTQVTILNDDDPGTVGFAEPTVQAISSKTSVSIPVIRKDGYDGNMLVFVKTVDGKAKAGTDYVALEEEYELHFEHEVKKAVVEIQIKPGAAQNSSFTVEITAVEPEGAKMDEKLHKCTVIITDDAEYKKLMEEVVAMMDEEMEKYGVGTSTWGEQFHNAMNMESDMEEPGWADYLLHFISFYWKVLHAIVPPTDYCGGWATFFVSLLFIGVITCFVGDCAKMLGCVIGLKDSVTAITFVALGTSLPDTFASMQATVEDDTADAAITNVTGSNSVNVFLGLGLPWLMAAIYHATEGTKYVYPAGDLVFSVIVFFVFAILCIVLLVVRRNFFGGELGGNKTVAYTSSAFLALSWVSYVTISALKTYGHI